jgi:hypothetical protein
MGEVRARRQRIIYCSFCGMADWEVTDLIKGPNCAICDVCVGQCVDAHNPHHGERMNIQEACAAIMGDRLANAIIADRGLHWCVVAAMAQATTADNPTALRVIREWRPEVPNDRR